jgi:hypothetical protein
LIDFFDEKRGGVLKEAAKRTRRRSDLRLFQGRPICPSIIIGLGAASRMSYFG